MKTLDFGFKIKALDEKTGVLEGYGSVFGKRDSYNEAVMPGAFTASLVQHRREGTWPAMLWQHNDYEPIGVWDDIAEDAKGLYVKGTLLAGVRRAEEALIMLKAGALQGMSIGYREEDVEPAKDGAPRKLLKVSLKEVSIVTFPALRQARVESVKSEEYWHRLQLLARKHRDGEPMPIKEFEDVLREAGFSKSVATQIASVGYARVIRSESEDHEAKAAESIVANASKAIDALLSLSKT